MMKVFAVSGAIFAPLILHGCGDPEKTGDPQKAGVRNEENKDKKSKEQATNVVANGQDATAAVPSADGAADISDIKAPIYGFDVQVKKVKKGNLGFRKNIDQMIVSKVEDTGLASKATSIVKLKVNDVVETVSFNIITAKEKSKELTDALKKLNIELVDNPSKDNQPLKSKYTGENGVKNFMKDLDTNGKKLLAELKKHEKCTAEVIFGIERKQSFGGVSELNVTIPLTA